MLSCSHPAPLPAWPHVKVTGLSRQSASHSPVWADADVMHVELDGLGLLLVFEMVIGQQVVELIYHWRGGVSPFWEAGHLAGKKAKIKEGGARDSDVTSNAANLGPFTSAQDRPSLLMVLTFGEEPRHICSSAGGRGDRTQPLPQPRSPQCKQRLCPGSGLASLFGARWWQFSSGGWPSQQKQCWSCSCQIQEGSWA